MSMDKITAVDRIIEAARAAGAAQARGDNRMLVIAEQDIADNRERIIDSIHAWCDCGKGSLCPQFGADFQHA
jgi:hypothetical protein